MGASTPGTAHATPAGAARRAGTVCSAVLAAACGGAGTSPSPPKEVQLPPPPTLESVAYERLGGGKLAFLRTTGDGNYLYVVDAAARAVTALGMYPLSADPALSPDGTRIAYMASSGFESLSGYDVSTKGLAGADSQRVSALPGQETSPSWSADGRSVYFFFFPIPAGPAAGIYRQPVAPGPLAPTAVLTNNADVCFSSPPGPVSATASGRLAFSCVSAVHTANADGSRLAFSVMAGGLTSRIHVVGVDGAGLTQLTTRPDALDHSVTWVR